MNKPITIEELAKKLSKSEEWLKTRLSEEKNEFTTKEDLYKEYILRQFGDMIELLLSLGVIKREQTISEIIDNITS